MGKGMRMGGLGMGSRGGGCCWSRGGGWWSRGALEWIYLMMHCTGRIFTMYDLLRDFRRFRVWVQGCEAHFDGLGCICGYVPNILDRVDLMVTM